MPGMLLPMLCWLVVMLPRATPSPDRHPACQHSTLGLVCNFNSTPDQHEEEPVDLSAWPEIDSVFIHQGRLELRGATCKNIHLYNTSATFPETYENCPPRNVLLQHSEANRIPGKVRKLDILYSKLRLLDGLQGLDRAFIVSSKVDRAIIRDLINADIKIVDSVIGRLERCDVGPGTSLNFAGSNVTLAENEAVVIKEGGLLTLRRSQFIASHREVIRVQRGGTLSVISSPDPLTLFDPNLLKEPEQLTQQQQMAKHLQSSQCVNESGTARHTRSASASHLSSGFILVVCLAFYTLLKYGWPIGGLGRRK